MADHGDLQHVYEYSPQPVLAFDGTGVVVYANSKTIQDYFPAGGCLGQPVSRLIDKQVRNDKGDVQNLPETAFPEGEYRLRTSAGEQRNVLISSMAHPGGANKTLVYLFIRDITVLKKKENLLAFLNTATEELSRARDTKTALDKISKLIVPKFATWFSIDLLKDGKLTELILAHEDPQMVEWARKYREAYPTDPAADTGTARVLRTGIPNCIPVITPEMVQATIRQPEQLELVNKMNLQSVITVAIYIKDIIAGIINFVSSSPGIHYDETDVQFSQNFANHVGLALENARLNEAANSEITGRRQIESKLKLAQVHLQSALSSGLVGTWVRDLEKNLLFADESLSAMFGLPYMPEGCDPEDYEQLITPGDRAVADEKRQKAIKEADFYEIEYQVKTTGGLKWFFARGKNEKDETGRAVFFTGVMIDITERKNAELLQKENEKKFRFLADAVPHKIWISAADGKATYYNKGWYDYSGVTGLDELRSMVWDMLHPDDRIVAAIEFPKLIQSGGQMEQEQRLRRFDGQYRWHLTRLYPHRDESGNISLWIGTCTDIHEQKESEHRKDEFLAIASHELKTPLTTIKAYNQLMEALGPGQPIEEFIHKSAKSIYRLERLVNDLLDVTKLNAGKIGYIIQPFNFKEMLLDSIGNLKYNTTHEIILEHAPDIEFTGDRARLEQVMNNLLSNAIKYSPNADKVLVNCTIEKRNIIVAVRDFGIGIAPENLDKLFNRYYRIDNSTMHFEGLGLGLFISSEILRHHQGSFWIESEPGKGSTFYFRLPLALDHTEERAVRTDDYYQDEHITIRFNKKDRRLDSDWTGFQDLASVKQGCLLLLEYVKKHKTDRIVNDNSNVTGTWSEASDWVGNVWFPLMEKAGLKFFAHILSPNIFAQLSAKKSIDIMAGIITTQYFTDLVSAREWIESLPYPPAPDNSKTK
jgi:PAS domain S-box-containing protein